MGREAQALALSALLIVAGSAQAQLYVCTDAKGRTISADQPPRECADRPVRELRRDGSVRRVIEPPPTAEERAARAAEEKRQVEEAERQRQQMRKDLALLDAYANEQELEQTRDRALAARAAVLERGGKRIEELRRERKKLDTEAEFYAKREMPEKLKRAFATNDTLVKNEEKLISDSRAEMQRLNERFDADLKRFRELVQAGGKPAVR